MNRLLDRTTLLGVLVLIIGLVAGVFLVQQNQQFRERAGLQKEQLIVVCHKIPDSVFWEELEVTEGELEARIDSGDLLGNCPNDFPVQAQVRVTTNQPEVIEETDKKTVEAVDNAQGKKIIDQEDIEEIVEPTPTRIVTTVPTNTPQPIVTIVSNDAMLRFFLKVQGVDAKRPARLINLYLDKDGAETHSYKNVRISPNSEGVYFGEVGPIPSGNFDISFKTDSHLKKTFKNIEIVSGINTWYFENNPLLAGDFNDDNLLDVTDVALLIAEMDGNSSNVVTENARFDIDVNARIDQADLRLVLENYKNVTVKGD